MDIQIDLTGEPLDDVGFVPQPSDRFAQFISEFVQTVTAHIFQLDVLEIVPGNFVRLQLRHVAWQLRQIQTRCTPFTKKGSDLPTAMIRQSIPDDQQLAA